MDPVTIVMLILLVVLIFFIFRNRKKRQAQQAELQDKMQPGVEVMLTFGIYGTLVAVNEEENVAEVEIAPGTVIKVHRQTLGRVVEPVVSDSADSAVDPTETTPSYSLNEDHAVRADEPSFGSTTAPAPEFGERVDTNSASRDADKGDN